MALKVRHHLTALIVLLAGISSVLSRNANLERYESYDLVRGPVFYEAYYPDASNDRRSALQEKRYFDRDAVLERTYQLPTNDRFTYPGDVLPANAYQERPEQLRYSNEYPPGRRFPEARNYLQSTRTRIPNVEYQDYNVDVRNALPFESKDFVESTLVERARNPNELPSTIVGIPRDSRVWNSMNSYRDPPLGYQPSLQRQDSIDYRRGSASFVGNVETERSIDGREQRGSSEAFASRNRATVDTAPPMENIFAPRPQVINYVFSRPKDQATTKKEDASRPRSYGDNLIQEEIRNTEESKDNRNVEVTSIEISDVPRRKTRHHHGEWPKRDFSHYNRT